MKAQKRVILVTGVSRFWGARVAQRLIEDGGMPDEYRVIGLDSDPLPSEIKGLDFIQADIRNPLLAELLKTEKVHTICHLQFVEKARHSDSVFDSNVMGTMKLLGACAQSGVKKFIIKSSMEVYGAAPSNPAFITEEQPISGGKNYAYTRELVEIDAFCAGFLQQVPEICTTVLRFANIVGPQANTPMTRFLKQPLAPVIIGFDPRMQAIHEQDVIDALILAIHKNFPGGFNIAAEGILPLSKILALSGKIPFPLLHPFAYLGAKFVMGLGGSIRTFLPFDPDYLRYSWVGSVQKMKDVMGFAPRYTAEEALREFAGEQRLRRFMPDASLLAYDEQRLRDTIERRSRNSDDS